MKDKQVGDKTNVGIDKEREQRFGVMEMDVNVQSIGQKDAGKTSETKQLCL